MIGIDLSLRSTGLVSISNNDINYQLITPSPKKYNDEELIIFNREEIKSFISKYNPSKIALEGLSFGSLSGSKDILAGNFWSVRTMIKEFFPNIELSIVPVLTWRSKLFNKEERKEMKTCESLVKEFKPLMKNMSKSDKTQFLIDNEEIIHRSNIKYLTWLKLPETIRLEFEKVGFSKGTFDLTDAYFLAKHIG